MKHCQFLLPLLLLVTHLNLKEKGYQKKGDVNVTNRIHPAILSNRPPQASSTILRSCTFLTPQHSQANLTVENVLRTKPRPIQWRFTQRCPVFSPDACRSRWWCSRRVRVRGSRHLCHLRRDSARGLPNRRRPVNPCGGSALPTIWDNALGDQEVWFVFDWWCRFGIGLDVKSALN